MAQLAIAVAGAAVGFAIGGPLGAAALGGQIGFVAGSMIGALAFAPEQDIPKVGDLKAPQVQYGTALPRLYGSNRTSGTLAWYSTKRVIPGDSGGKGTPTAPTADTAEIDVLYILAVDSDVIAVTRVWKNGELVWSKHAASDDASIDASASVDHWTELRFLDGNAAQLPDPAIEAQDGVGNVPAYRHRQCVMIEGLKLWQSGQIPLLEFECVTAGTINDGAAQTQKYADNVAETELLGTALQPFGAVLMATATQVSAVSISTQTVKTYPVSSAGVESAAASDAIPVGYNSLEPGNGNGTRAVMVFGTLNAEVAGFGMAGDGVSLGVNLPQQDNWLGTSDIRFATTQTRIAVTTALALNIGPNGYDFSGSSYSGNQGRIYVYDYTGTLVEQIEAGIPVECVAMSSSTVWALSSGNVYPFDGTVAGASFAVPAGTGHMIFASSGGVLHCANAGQQVYKHDGAAWSLVTTLDATDAAALGTADGCQYSASPTYVYAAKGVSESVTEDHYRYWMRPATGDGYLSFWAAILAYADYYFSSFHWGTGADERAIRNTTITVTIVSDDRWDALYSCERLYGYPGDTSGEFDDPLDQWIWAAASTSQIFDRVAVTSDTYTRYYHDLYRQAILETVDPLTVDLADIVTAEWERVSDASLIDVSDLVGIPVRGFQTGGSVRGALEALAPVFHFGAVCADKLYFRLQGGSSAATIASDDLAAAENQAAEEPFAPERANDGEIAERLSITYPNVSDDYAPGSETGSRGSDGNIVVVQQSNVVMTPAEAKAVVETLAAQASISATTARISLTDYHAALEPTDAITVPDEDGTAYRMRIVRETVGAGVRQLELVRDDVTSLVAPGLTSASYTQSLTVSVPPETEIVLLDVPILRDTDNDAGFYTLAKGFSRGPSRLFRSADGITYAEELAYSAQGVFGTCGAALGDWAGGRVFDETSSVTVDVGEGTLSSTTRAAILSDQAANACAIGVDGRWELCQFRSALLLSAGVYVLSGFLRGARGTEWASSGHVSGEAFVLLTTAAKRATVETGDLGVAEYYKGVSAGRLLSTATAQSFTDNAVGLHPFAPCHVRVARDSSNDCTITFERRTRMSTRFASSLGIVCPLGEATESYEVDIYASGAYATVVRTLTGSTPSLGYTAAQQTADGLTPGATLYLRVYQLNEIVGRGYPAEKAA